MVKPLTARAKAYRHIKQEILTGAFPPGFHLREERLTEIIGVSRTPVRQALSMLAGEGFVYVNDNKRSYVMDVDEESAEEIFDLLIKLEGYSANLAAKKIDPQKLQELEELHQRMVELSSGDNYNDEIFLDLNAQFHDKVHLLSGNKQLYEMIKKIVNFPTIIYLKFNVRTESDGSIHHHGEILRPCVRGMLKWLKS